MLRHAGTAAEPTTTATTTTTTNANAKTPLHKDKDIDGSSSLTSCAVVAVETDPSACRPEHAFHAFDALYCALTNATPVKPLFPDNKYPLFVTWNTRVARRANASASASGWSTRLRGCIGTFDAQPLRDGLEEYALLSAFRDHRFRRVELRELPSLECGISLLTDFEDATSYRDWTVGTHGIQITFTPPPTSPPASDAPSPLSSAVSLLSRPLASFSSSSSSSHGVPTATTIRRALSATYLPEVAPDQGWGHIDAIDSAIRKAGWNDRISEDLRRAVRVRRYRSRKCVVGWDEFVAWRAERGFPVSVDLLDDHERGFNHLGHGQEEEEEDDEEDEDKDGF